MSGVETYSFFGRVVRETSTVVPLERRLLCFGALVNDAKQTAEAGQDNTASAEEEGEEEGGAQRRRGPSERTPLIVRDAKGCIPFVHSGMYISVCAERGDLRQGVSEAHDWRDYEYRVLYVKRSAAASKMRAVDWRRALSTISVHDAVKRARESESRQSSRQRAPVIFPIKRREKPLIDALVAASSATNLCVADARMPEVTGWLRDQMWARYALEHGALNLLHTDLAETIGNLRLDAWRAAQAPICDLDELGRLIAEHCAAALAKQKRGASGAADEQAADADDEPKKKAPPPPPPPLKLVFFGAAVPLPAHHGAAGDLLASWPGITTKGLTKRQCSALVNTWSDPGERAVLTQAEAHNVLQLAVNMHRFRFNVQRSAHDERWCDTVFGAKRTARYVARNNNNGGPFGVERSEQAIDFLMRERVWMPAYGRRGQRLTLASFVGAAAMQFDTEAYCCTARDWASEKALADELLALDPLLVDVGVDQQLCHTGSLDALESLLIDRQVVLEGTDALDVLWLTAGNSPGARLRSVDALIAHAQHDTNEDRYAAELLCYDAVVICDTQRLSRAELLLVCRALRRVSAQRAELIGIGGEQPPFGVALLGDVSKAAGVGAFVHAYRSEALRSVAYRASDNETQQSQISLAFSISEEDEGAEADAARPVSVSEERKQVNWLQMALHNAADDAVWRTQLLKQMFGVRSEARRTLCVLPRASQIVERFDNAVDDGSQFYGTCRWLLLAEKHQLLSDTWRALGDELVTRNTPHLVTLGAQLRTMASAPHAQSAAERTVLFAAPFVGWRRRAVRVTRAWIASARLESTKTHFERDSRLLFVDARADSRPALDLDEPRLLIELMPDNSDFVDCDHRVCCRTWAANVMHVAVHRAQLSSQSFVLARDALPLYEPKTELVACAPLVPSSVVERAHEGAFCYDDLRAAFIDAAGPLVERLVLAGVTRVRAPAMLAERRGVPQQQLERILRSSQSS